MRLRYPATCSACRRPLSRGDAVLARYRVTRNGRTWTLVCANPLCARRHSKDCFTDFEAMLAQMRAIQRRTGGE
jgi:hypothetical protein